MNNPWKTVDPRNNLSQTTHPLVKTWLTLLAKPKDLVLLSIYHLLHKYITPYFPTLSQPAFTSSKFTIETLEQFLFSHFYNLFYCAHLHQAFTDPKFQHSSFCHSP